MRVVGVAARPILLTAHRSAFSGMRDSNSGPRRRGIGRTGGSAAPAGLIRISHAAFDAAHRKRGSCQQSFRSPCRPPTGHARSRPAAQKAPFLAHRDAVVEQALNDGFKAHLTTMRR
jgi:hypothetical protein